MTGRTTVSAGVALAAALVAAPAAAELKWDNASGGYVRIYGQISPAWQSVDDGVTSKDTFVDNTHSNSRVGLWVVQPLNQSTFKFNFETALGLRGSGGVSQTSTPKGIDWDRTSIRKVDLSFSGDSWGSVHFGQGSMASDGIADISLNHNAMTTYNSVGDFAGGFEFRTTAGALSGVTIAAVNPSLDGGRQGRVRYDTPSFNGFSVALAAGTDVLTLGNSDKYYDIALRYAGEFNGAEVKAGLGFSRRDRAGVNRDDTFGSVAVKLRSGFNFAAAAGSRKNDGNYGYVLVGYEAQFWQVGLTSFAIDYYNGNDFGLAGRQSETLGIGINQNFDASNTQVYLGYRNHRLSDPGTSYNDVDAFLFGARWRF
ncbi:porin [Ruegeria marina]|uniref:Outer membrane protein (Porin) n=1 Tax=Ruegeria marina TaxID=639004 RepID=A0A1G6QHY4_9RHOB|nr:porin [Ruegeria marina]SDC91326.1 hypothetical protein SAMN04488239_104116 [Ruegeria marina]